jgi:hypothetical protein
VRRDRTRIELALARQLRQVAAVALERLIRAFRVFVRDALRAADAGQRAENRVARHFQRLQQLRGGGAAAFVGDRDEEVLGADVVVLHAAGLGLGGAGDFVQTRREAGLGAAVRRRDLPEQLAAGARHGRGVGVHLTEQLRDDALALLDECDEDVLRFDLRVVVLPRELDGLRNRFACFLGVLVDVHGVVSSFCSASKCVFCSGVRVFGSCTSTVAYRSPCSPALPAGIP